MYKNAQPSTLHTERRSTAADICKAIYKWTYTTHLAQAFPPDYLFGKLGFELRTREEVFCFDGQWITFPHKRKGKTSSNGQTGRKLPGIKRNGELSELQGLWED